MDGTAASSGSSSRGASTLTLAKFADLPFWLRYAALHVASMHFPAGCCKTGLFCRHSA